MTEALALGVAAVLLAAGALKLRDPRTFAATLRKLAPRRWRRQVTLATARAAARTIALAEILVASGLTLTSGDALRASALGAVTLGGGFTVAVATAVRRGQTCGCFGSLRPKAAGRVEIARAVGVLVAAVLVAASPPARIPLAGRVALVVAGALAARAFAISRLVRVRPRKVVVAGSLPPVDGAVERLRAADGMREIERRLEVRGGAIDWASARVAAAGSVLLISAGRRPGAVLTARLGHPSQPVTVHVAYAQRRLWLRSGEVVEAEVSGPPRASV